MNDDYNQVIHAHGDGTSTDERISTEEGISDEGVAFC